jgi:hypothetical protein
MTVEGLPFAIVTVAVHDGVITGSVAGPPNTTSDGVSFTHVGPGNNTLPISSASINGDRLHLVVKNPKDPADEDEWELTVSDAEHASLSDPGAPFAPWPLTRANDPIVQPTWDPNRTYSLQAAHPVPNAEMAAIYEADQHARERMDGITDAQWQQIAKDDTDRRAQTHALLGMLHAGEDFRKAAFIFQHGETPDDYLVAHTLALVALAKGDTEAKWIAAVSLDRYLNAIGKPQIYGGNFEVVNGVAHQKAFNAALVSDDLRGALGVPPAALQLEQFKAVMKPTKR